MPGISDLLDSDMEPSNFMDENSLISSVSEDGAPTTQSKATIKKGRKRKPLTVPKKSRAKSTAEPKPNASSTAAGTKRKAGEVEPKEEDDETDELVETVPPKPRAQRPKSTSTRSSQRLPTKTTKSRANIATIEQENSDAEEPVIPSPVVVRSNLAQTKSTKALPKPVAARSKASVNRPVRAPSKVVEEVVTDIENEYDQEMVSDHQPRKRMRTESRMRQEPTFQRRAGSASDAERGDPMLRRKLGDITRKYENIDIKYRNLKDVAISEANTNVEKMRKQCEAITEASDKLVISLRKELALQAPLIQESRKLKKDMQTHGVEVERLRTANNGLSKTLTAAQNEIKSLQAKLAAARSTPAPVETKVPTSTLKPTVLSRSVMLQAGPNQFDKEAQLKLDLYGDLTGLIIRGVKHTEDGETYDCIQTGRNGTLHFKLFVDSENAKKASFEETEYLYTPLLDMNRDRDLIEMMPDYLTEDITFVREVAAKFYARVVRTLTEKPEATEEEVE